MKLETVVPDLEDIPEDIRENYEKRGDGRYHLTAIADGTPIEDVSELRKALERERSNVNDSKKAMQQMKEKFDGVDFDKARYQELLDNEARREEQEAESKGEWHKLRDTLVQTHADNLAKLQNEYDSKMEAMTSSLSKYLVDGSTATAIAEQKGNVQLLMPHVKNSVRMVEEGGEYAVRVVGPDGEPRLKGDGTFLSASELVAEMRGQEMYAACFEGSNASGSGATESQASGGKPNGKIDLTTMSTQEKTAFIQEFGLAEFQARLG